MKTVHAAVLFAALTGVATCLFERDFILVEMYSSWTDAQAYCRNNYDDLTTITSLGHINELSKMVSPPKNIWIGLSKKPQDTAYTQWSDGSSLTYAVWKDGEPNNLTTSNCVTLTNSEFEAHDCGNTLMFFCQTLYPELIVVEEMKTWEEALHYCRIHYTDLVSVSTSTDWYAIDKILKKQTTSVWTGLRFMDGQWFWVNQETVESLFPLPSCPARPFHCGALTAGMVLQSRDCNEEMNFICYMQEDD